MSDPNLDPDGPALPDAGVFGAAKRAEEAGAWILPLPLDATASYRRGASMGPAAMVQASHQVELTDVDVGKPHEVGFFLEAEPEGLKWLNHRARVAADRVHRALAQGKAPAQQDIAQVDEAGERVEELARAFALRALDQGAMPIILGGDHSVPLGAIRAAAEASGPSGLGILHIDAHADLRVAYEGFAHSHASIMHNAMSGTPGIEKLVQVGLRDVGQSEVDAISALGPRVAAFFDVALRQARFGGNFLALCGRIVDQLPQEVWISMDIDGLDPSLCPNTGTPVPGGLAFDEVLALFGALAQSGRRVVGFDLCEVAPDPVLWGQGEDSWDAMIGARLLYKMMGFSLFSRGHAICGPLDLPRAPG
jgi:agmatinase